MATLKLKNSTAVVCGVVSLVATSLVSSSFGAIKTWDAGGVAGNPGNWSANPNNWDADTAPAPGDQLVFPFVTTGFNRSTTNDFAAGTSFGPIGATASGYTLAGNSINLSGDVSFNPGNASSTFILSLPMVLQQNTNFQSVGIVSGTQPRIEVSGAISGSYSLTKTGTGNLRMTGTAGSRTYTGDTIISAGNLDFNVDNAIPFGAGKGDVILDLGATLTNNNFNVNINALKDGPNGGGNVFKSGSNTRSITVGNGDASGRFSGNYTHTVGGSSSLLKVGAGTQIMAGTIATNGAGSVSGGRLIIDGTWTTGSVNAAAGGTLGGKGTIGNTAITGKLAPGGDLVGDTTAVFSTSNLTINAAGEVDFDIDGLTRGSSYDGLNLSATGVLTYGGGKLALDFGSAPAAGTYDLFSFTVAPAAANLGSIAVTGAISGSLTGAAGVWTGTFGGATLTFTESTGDLVVTVPEPTSIAAVAGLAIATLRRRRA